MSDSLAIYNVGNITQTLTKILILDKNLVIIQTTWTGGIYMLKKYGCIILCLLCFISTPLQADITKISDLSLLNEQLETLNENDLVIFDIDEVVIQPVDQIFHPHNKKELHKYYSDIQNKISPEQMNQLLSVVNLQQQVKLVDPNIIDIFYTLSKRSIPTIALTHCGTGKFGRINDVADWRISQLGGVGISFKNLTPYKNQVYHQLKGKHGTAMFKSGILFTGYIDKGEVLAEFLQQNKISPRKIIFVDDKKSNLDSVEATMQAYNINFSGYEYVAVSQQNIIKIDSTVTDLQFHALQNENKWLPDSVARSKIGILK